MTATVKNFGSAIADQMNPFTRLVITATSDDGAPGVPYFQSEKVKEAAAQSEYGCDSVYKAIMQRIESKSSIVQFKCLSLIRTLMIEGPAAFGTKVSMNQSRFFTLAQLHDVRKDSLEAHVKQLAQNIQDACNGKGGALMRPVGEADTSHGLASATNMSTARAKSDFQEAQEREAKAFRKKREEEKKAMELVTTDKHFDTYDATLPAARLVASAVQTSKKKLAPEELCNFHEAVVKHTKPAEVIAALDQVLRDIKEPLQTKFKVLALVEHMVVTVPYHEAVVHFKSSNQGLMRLSQLQATPDAPKAGSMAVTATTVLRVLATCIVPPPHVRGEPVPRPAAMPNLGGSAPSGQHTVGAAALSAAPMFEDLALKSRPRATSGAAASLPSPASSSAAAASQPQPQGFTQQPTFSPAQQQQQPAAAAWGAPAPAAPANHVDPAAEQLRLMQLQMQQQMAMMSGMMAQIQMQNAAAVPPVPAAVQPNISGPSSRSESVASAFPQHVANPQPAWSSSVAGPPPLVIPSAAPAAPTFTEGAYGQSFEHQSSTQSGGRMRSDSTISDTTSAPSVPNNTIVTPMGYVVNNGSFTMSQASGMASPAEPAPSPVSAAQSRTSMPSFAMPPSVVPPVAAVPAPSQPMVTLDMLQKLQAQMAETQAILAKQQAMYDKMKQQFLEQQEAQMKAFQMLQGGI